MRIYSLHEKWAAIDQLGGGLRGLWLTEKELAKIGRTLELKFMTAADRQSYERLLLKALLKACREHGNDMLENCRLTLVRKEVNERNRHYRHKEFRLYFGNYSSFIVEFGVTPDGLDIDPKRPQAAWHVKEDDDLRSTQAEKPLKALLREYVANHAPGMRVEMPPSAEAQAAHQARMQGK